MLNILMFLLAILSIIVIRRLLMLFPGAYFSIQDIVTVDSNDLSLLGLVLRFGVVFVFGLIILFLSAGKWLYVVEYSLYTSFLLIWPFIMDKIILYNRREDGLWGPKSRQPGLLQKYLFVYLLYSLVSLGFSLLALPVYNLIHNQPALIYRALLSTYLSWDPLAQSLFSNILAAVALSVVIVVLRAAYKSLLRRKK